MPLMTRINNLLVVDLWRRIECMCSFFLASRRLFSGARQARQKQDSGQTVV
jgi:hypothetical protein